MNNRWERFSFRIWTEKIGMVYDVAITPTAAMWTNPGPNKTGPGPCDITVLFQPYAQPPVMQCTGLKDKNGKLIYEGDVVQDEDEWRYDIRWHGGFASVIAHYIGQGDEAIEHLINTFDWELVEIVGNIYENPELLKHGDE